MAEAALRERVNTHILGPLSAAYPQFQLNVAECREMPSVIHYYLTPASVSIYKEIETLARRNGFAAHVDNSWRDTAVTKTFSARSTVFLTHVRPSPGVAPVAAVKRQLLMLLCVGAVLVAALYWVVTLERYHHHHHLGGGAAGARQ